MKKIICFTIALLFMTSFTVQANQFPPFPANEAVLDTQNVLSASTVDMLVYENHHMFEQTGGEVLFYITDFLPMGYTVSNFTLELFNSWEVGSADNNNGVLMVLALATGDHHITVGEGLSHHMGASYLYEVTHTYFIDYFNAGNYDAAVSNIFSVLSAEIRNIFPTSMEVLANPAPAGQAAQTPAPQNGPRGNNNWFIIVVVVIVLLLLMPRRRRGFGGGMFGRRRMGGGGMMGGMLGGYLLGRARHRQPTVRQSRTQAPRTPTAGSGFTRGGSSTGGYGGRSGGFTRGGSSRGGGYGGRRR